MEVSQIALLTLIVLIGGFFGLAVVPEKKRALLHSTSRKFSTYYFDMLEKYL